MRFLLENLDTGRPATRGAKPTLEKYSPPLEKCVGHSLKLLDIVSKIWVPLRKLFAPLVFQTGYGPGYWVFCASLHVTEFMSDLLAFSCP